MSHIVKITLNLSTILLIGCSTSPSDMSSEIIAPQTTRNGTQLIQNQHDLSQVMWWKKMHDPVLNHLIADALAHNNQIITAQANTLESQAKLKAAQFAWVPTLNAAGNGFTGGTWDNDLTPKGILATSPALANQGNMHFRGYYSGFVPSYSLNIMQNINADTLAKASLDMQNAVYNATRLSIISQVSGAYFMLLGHKAQQRDQLQLIHDLKKNRQLEKVRFKDGASDLSTVAQMNKQISNAEATLASTNNSIAQVENAIQVLINHNPGPIDTHQSINALSVKGIVPANLPSSVLKNRPDMMMAEENLKISKANLGLAYSQFFPAITLTGLFGGASVDLSHLLSLSTGLWITQVAGSIPLLNGAAYQQINAAKAGNKAAYYSYLQTVRSVFADVDNSLTNQQQMNEAYHHQFNALKASQTTYELVLARYNAGAKDYREVMNAKLNVDYAKLDLNLAKMQQLDSIVQVYQSLAGGYAGV
jgi:NodT family efflux transporter outer membrane factor (OMF) lipoprotein